MTDNVWDSIYSLTKRVYALEQKAGMPMLEPRSNIETVLEQLNNLSSTQIMIIQQIKELRGRVKALEDAHTGPVLDEEARAQIRKELKAVTHD